MGYRRRTLFFLFLLILLVPQNALPQAGQSGLPSGLTPTVSPESADVDAEPQPAAATTITQSKPGNLAIDKPDFPSFYIWRRVYQKRGTSYFKPFLVTQDGALVPAKKTKETIEDWDAINSSNVDKEKTRSPSTHWEIELDEDPHFTKFMQLNFQRTSDGSTQTVNVPGTDGGESELDWWGFEGWNPQKDLCYFYTSGGADTGRNEHHYQYDPQAKVFVDMGRAPGDWFFLGTVNGSCIWMATTWLIPTGRSMFTG